MAGPLKVLMITTEWPSPAYPSRAPFVVRQAEFLRKAGVNLTVFPFSGSKDPRNYAKAWREVRQILKRERFDLIHAQWGQSALAALGSGLPLVVTFRGDDLEGIVGDGGRYTLQGSLLQRISQWSALRAKEVIVVADSLAKHFRRRRYHVIPSGLDLDLFRPIPMLEARRQLGIQTDKPLVLFAGAAGNPRKRIELARAAVELARREIDTELIVASNIPITEIPLYMNACDTLLLTSLHEGSPNVVKEALACNLPVVSTPVGDVRQRLGAVPGCQIIENDRPEAIAALLVEVLRCRERVNGRDTVLDLDENALTRRVIGVYEQALR